MRISLYVTIFCGVALLWTMVPGQPCRGGWLSNSCAHAATETRVDPTFLQERYRKIQQRYRRLDADGHDLAELNIPILRLRNAFRVKDWTRVAIFLDRIDQVLVRIESAQTVKVTPDKPLDAGELQQRYRQVQSEYHDKRAAGFDLSGINPLVLELREAFESKDWVTVNGLLDQIAIALRDVDRGARKRAHEEPVREAPSRVGRPLSAQQGFAFGLDYARPPNWMNIPNPPKLFAEMGTGWIKFAGVPWSIVEPTADGGYQWQILDSLVRSYQSYGFKILAVLICDAPWAVERDPTKGALRGGARTASPPRDGFWARYASWISAVVERYDMDGDQDMPGLREPVLDFEIESEAQHDLFWDVPKGRSPAGEYRKLLETAYVAAHRANPEVRIILSGMNFGDLFDDGTSKSTEELVQFVKGRFSDRPGMKELYLSSLRFSEESLSYHEFFDAVEFHYNHDYRAGYPTVQWIRSRMAAHGYSKPIWAGDALIANARPIHSTNHSFPLRIGDRGFTALDNADHSNHRDVWNWHLADQASNLVKKVMVALDTQLVGIMAANEADWPSWRSHGKFWVYAGFFGQDHPAVPASVKGRRPVFYTYRLITNRLSGSGIRTQRVAHSNPHVYLYRVTQRDEQPFLVGWYDDQAERRLLDTANSLLQVLEIVKRRSGISIDASAYLPTQSVTVSRIVTELEGRNAPRRPPSKIVPAREVLLSGEPIFIEPSMR